jgi:hypothetical protein
VDDEDVAGRLVDRADRIAMRADSRRLRDLQVARLLIGRQAAPSLRGTSGIYHRSPQLLFFGRRTTLKPKADPPPAVESRGLTVGLCYDWLPTATHARVEFDLNRC